MPRAAQTARAAAPRTVRALIRWAAGRFRRARLHYGHGTGNARDEAAWLVGHVAGFAPDALAAHLDEPLAAATVETVRALTEQRIQTRQPLAYLLHEAWFAGLRFYVDARVIVPRSLIAEFIEERFRPWVGRVRRVLDLCTGSGCMAVALARAFPAARVDASDISAAALEVARINVEHHGLSERIQLIQSDLFSALPGERYDLIVTNPPYVAAAEMETLPEEYRHEPELALVSGASGLDAVTRILAAAPAHLHPDGILVAEVGNSCAALQETFPDLPFIWLSTASGDDSVFLLTAEEWNQRRTIFRDNT